MLRTSLCLVASLLATPVAAQTLEITGTRENANPLSPPGSGRCAPAYFNTVDIAPGATSSTGNSNLGTFTSTQSHCIVTAPPTAIADGAFTYTFSTGETLTGTYAGSVDATGTPGQFLATENLVFTGGTGRFTNASGTITDNGPLSFANNVGVFKGTIAGTINASAETATGNFASAAGPASAAIGDHATAYGGLALASGIRAAAVGSDAQAQGVGATALGDQTRANGASATALGQLAVATGPAASALGHNSVANGIGATAVGVRANAAGVGALAAGRLSAASAANATALGASASASFAGSTAVGTGATTTAVNQVALGGVGSAVRVGDIGASTAAQSGSVDVATVDAAGTLGRNAALLPTVAALQTASAQQGAALGEANGRIDTLYDLREADRGDFKRGVAAAVAMGQAAFPSEPGRTSYVLNGGVFRGQAAVGGSLMHRIASDTPFAIGLGISVAGKKNNAFRAGVAGEF
jgi:hypothetical protein